MTAHLTRAYSMKCSTMNPNATASVVVQFQYKDNVLIAQKIVVTKTITDYRSSTTSTNQLLNGVNNG
jgi:hypothetical protein